MPKRLNFFKDAIHNFSVRDNPFHYKKIIITSYGTLILKCSCTEQRDHITDAIWQIKNSCANFGDGA